MARDDEYHIPLQEQRVFGAGIKRKRIDFVPAQPSLPQQSQPSTSINAGENYLSIVFGNAGTQTPLDSDRKNALIPALAAAPRCDICNLPLISANVTSTPHETSLVHQVCLAHSHPPSHLDRQRKGLKYLSSYGWDPDSRLGLGAKGEGVRIPLKAKAKNDTVGLGVKRAVRKREIVEKKKVERLDAKGVRKMELEGRKKAERLQQIFYGNEDVERYLGTAG